MRKNPQDLIRVLRLSLAVRKCVSVVAVNVGYNLMCPSKLKLEGARVDSVCTAFNDRESRACLSVFSSVLHTYVRGIGMLKESTEDDSISSNVQRTVHPNVIHREVSLQLSYTFTA